MRQIIVTGFEPYGQYKENPTRDLVKSLDGKKVGDFRVNGLVLPAMYYEAANKLLDSFDNPPYAIISTGLSSKILVPRLETTTRNEMFSKYKDARGRNPEKEPIIKGGPESYRTNIDSIDLANKLEAQGLKVEVSADANTFICNSLMYLTIRDIENRKLRTKFLFMHTPWTERYKQDIEKDKPTIPEEELEKIVRTLIKIV